MKICKCCGDEYNRTNSNLCGRCEKKAPLLPRYVKARDELRRLTGWTEKRGADKKGLIKTLSKRLSAVSLGTVAVALAHCLCLMTSGLVATSLCWRLFHC